MQGSEPPIHHDGWEFPADLREVRGVYQPMQFAVNVHPELQAKLSIVTRGIYTGGEIPGDVVYAFSTYFHETIHWWQHVGSTLGLLLSLSYPAQAHINHVVLQRLLESIGPVKSLRTFKATATELAPTAEHELNFVLNNWHDIEYCRRILLIPKLAETISRDQYFESIGHGLHLTWQATTDLLATSTDPKFKIIPNGQAWAEPFYDLRIRKVEGYHRNSRVFLIATGARSIFEGQARFSQLQYLHFSSDVIMDWESFHDLGLLADDYVILFDRFLTALDQPWPQSIDSPEVSLFLALCDIAINPGEGFPFDIRRFDTFIEDVDPGIRFFRLAVTAHSRKNELLSAAATYSADGYRHISSVLCADLDWRSPLEICARVAAWSAASSEAAAITEEDHTFRFIAADMPVRVFAGRFMKFQRDKLQYPHFFVWPGVHTANHAAAALPPQIAKDLFSEHEPLFRAEPSGEIRATQIQGRDARDVLEMFKTFYTWSAYYDLVRQWHIADGPFSFDYSWLTPYYDLERMRKWASRVFQLAFGISPEDFRIL